MSPEGIFKNIPRRISPFLQDSAQERARWSDDRLQETSERLPSAFRQDHF